ncbi:MAG TPA: hypothetical protein VFS49_01115 [Croceibacterium sp.]|nr:hypothetical protein [Croceibacterium sp.]
MSIPLMLAEALVTAPVFAAAPVSDAALAEMRGGIELPNGIDLALTVQTQTAIDGAVVLRTVFALVDGPPTIRVFAPAAGQTVAEGPAALSGATDARIGATVVLDASQGIQVRPGLAVLPVVVRSGPAAVAAASGGLEPVDAPAFLTDAGVVDRSTDGVTLTGADFSVTHFIGGAFGSAILNSGSDRTINTATTVSIDLRNAGPEVLGSAMLQVEDVALGATAWRP